MWFGMLTDLTMNGQSGSQPVVFVHFLGFFSRFGRDTLFSLQHDLQHGAHITQLRFPPCSKGIRFSYTGRGTVRRWICDPLRSRPQDLRGATSVPERMFSSSYTSGNHEGVTACPGQSTSASGGFWWEILLIWQRSCFPASFHFFHWAKPWGCCSSSQPWTKRTWTTNCDFSVHCQLALLL